MRKALFGGTFNVLNTLKIKNIFLLPLFILFYNTGFSQGVYSKQNLEQATPEELNVYLKVSEKKKTTGTVMSVAGPVMIITGSILFNESYDSTNYTKTDIGGYVLLAGLVTTIIGVPKLITGASRVKRINEIMDAKKVSFELAPCRFYDIRTHSSHPGITLRLKV